MTRDIAFPFGRVHLEHGHRSGGVSPEFVASCRCAYFFSGHTHRKLAFHHPFGTWQFNPGSLMKPRGGAKGSFLLLEVDEASGELLSYRFALVDPKSGEEVEGGEEKRFA